MSIIDLMPSEFISLVLMLSYYIILEKGDNGDFRGIYGDIWGQLVPTHNHVVKEMPK